MGSYDLQPFLWPTNTVFNIGSSHSLDSEPITHGTSDPNKSIRSPPPYKPKKQVNGASKTPSKADGRRSTRGGKGVRSESPTKKTPARKIATPRKSRAKGRGKSQDPDAVNGEETVKVEVENESKPSPDGDEDIQRTKVNVEMPAGSPDLELPNDTEGMLAKAREMVAEAEKIGGASSSKGKRKAVDIDEGDAGSPAPMKRAKTVELELRKERIKRRALTGIAATVAIGYVLEYVEVFGSAILTIYLVLLYQASWLLSARRHL